MPISKECAIAACVATEVSITGTRGKADLQRRLNWALMLNRAVARLVVFTAIISTPFSANAFNATAELDYQDRGGRYAEGVKPEPVSAYDIELISALVDYREALDHIPDQLRLSFYLPEHSNVDLVVRELDYRLYYWLDRVKPPPTAWRAGGQNEFVWQTGTVLSHLDLNFDVYELGALIRINKTAPSSVEDVSPAVLYSATLPSAIRGYLFTLKVNGDARLSCSVYREGKTNPIATQILRRIPGGRPFTVPWSTVGAPNGQYRLVCNGFFLDTNQPVEQTVRFYHHQMQGH
jgi:hypothetical protein